MFTNFGLNLPSCSTVASIPKTKRGLSLNPVNKAQMGKFLQVHGGAGMGETELFEVYSAYSILAGLLSESVDPFDVHLKGSEFGLDGAAILIQGNLVTNKQEVIDAFEGLKNPNVEFLFFQSKTSAKFEYGEISKFFDAVYGVFSGDMANESPQLDDFIAAKDEVYAQSGLKKNPSVKLYFVSLGTYEKVSRLEKLIRSTDDKLSKLNIFDAKSVEIHLVGATALQRYFRTATTDLEAKFHFPRSVPMPPNGAVEQAFIGYVPASEVLKLVSNFDENEDIVEINNSVFFDNIRDFDPDSEINKGIISSLERGEGKDFAFRNNGITVVAKTIKRTSDDFSIEDYQIVNGCQTSNIIYHARANIADVNVPLRLIGSKEDNFVSSIIVGTNRQNSVREEQFWALRPFMKNFEEYCLSVGEEDRLYFERRDNQFRGQVIEKVRLVQPSSLMKTVTAALVDQPNRSSRDYRRIYEENRNTLFLDDHDVRVYYASSYLNYRLDFLWRNQRLNSDYKLYRYYLIYVLSKAAAGGKNVLSMKKGDAAKYANALVELAKNEEKIKEFGSAVAARMESLLGDDIRSNRERVRDQMRSDTFFSRFSSSPFSIII